MGIGNMEILDVSQSVVYVALRFIKPFKNECIATFSLMPQGPSTKVTWAMDGPNSFMDKVMSIFMDMDKLIGGQFAEGLAELKKVAEK